MRHRTEFISPGLWTRRLGLRLAGPQRRESGVRRGRQALQLHGWRARQIILRCGARAAGVRRISLAVPLRRRFTTMASGSGGRRDCDAQRGPTPRDRLSARQSQGATSATSPPMTCAAVAPTTRDAGLRDGEGSRTGSAMARLTSLFAKLGSRRIPLDSSPLQPQGGADWCRRFHAAIDHGGLVKSRALWQDSERA